MEVDQFCFEVQPGEGRLAKCLDDQLVSLTSQLDPNGSAL